MQKLLIKQKTIASFSKYDIYNKTPWLYLLIIFVKILWRELIRFYKTLLKLIVIARVKQKQNKFARISFFTPSTYVSRFNFQFSFDAYGKQISETRSLIWSLITVIYFSYPGYPETILPFHLRIILCISLPPPLFALITRRTRPNCTVRLRATSHVEIIGDQSTVNDRGKNIKKKFD